MASIFQSTGTISNLTRLELEQLRKADSFAAGKALTVGDSALPPEGVVGKGDVNAEPFATAPFTTLADVLPLTPPTNPGPCLITTAQTSDRSAETVQWFGPKRINKGPGFTSDGPTGYATDASHWRDDGAGVDFTRFVQPGDLLLVKAISPGGYDNDWTVAAVSSVATHVLTVINVSNYHADSLSADSNLYPYLIVRPNAVQLFAVPGSGPLGREQTFLMVTPSSGLHNLVNPSVSAMNLDRVGSIVPPRYSGWDRADAVFKDATAPNLPLNKMGYRVVLYASKNDGSGPDLTKPILGTNPIIDPSIPAADQRMTIDYKAGVVRFSCAPAIGGDIKVAGGVNAVTGRLNLYAVYWAVDTSMTMDSAAQLWAVRGTVYAEHTAARVSYDMTHDAWVMGATIGYSDFFVRALTNTDAPPYGITKFGALDSTSLIDFERGFIYRPGRNTWTFTRNDRLSPTDPAWSIEMELGEKLTRTMGDITAPPMAQADLNPNPSLGNYGARTTENLLVSALQAASADSFGTLHLRKGIFTTDRPLVVPPGITIEGEGPATKVISNRLTAGTGGITQPVFRFGPNTYWGVYDATADNVLVDSQTVAPTRFIFSPDLRVEGMDVVWNPTRRVWATVYADVTANVIWFNEIGLDGSALFPGQGIDIKVSAAELFTNDVPSIGIEHTPGHYPRIVHHHWTDQYSVVWVENTRESPGMGPAVLLLTFQTIIPTAFGQPPTILRAFPTIYVPSEYDFCDHPSVSVDNSQNGMTSSYTIAVTFWSYAADLSSSKCSLATASISSLSSWTFAALTNYPQAVISSTDVAADGSGGFLATWSQRKHRLLMGVHGKVHTANSSNVASFTDPGGIGDFFVLGVEAGSKFLYLGLPAAPTWTWKSETYHKYPAFVTAYGTDGTVIGGSWGTLQIKTDQEGQRYGQATPWVIASGTGSGGGTSTLTDASAHFLGNVQIGDVVFESSDYGSGTFRGCVVTDIANDTTLYLDRNLDGVGFTYDVCVGRAFNYAIAPRSEIHVSRYYAGTGFVADSTVVGGTSTTNYRIDQREPDLVRLSRGGDKWLLVYQAFNTTSLLAGKSIRNFDDGYSASYLDSGDGLAVQDTAAPYREHIATCSLLLNDDGSSSIPNHALLDATSYMQGRISRDIEVSNRSLGARDPLTRRPNYYNDDNSYTVRGPRLGQQMAREVSALNFMHRYPLNHPPGLLPDVTWSGSDWTIVSPSKAHIHSYTGSYIVDGGGVVYLGDPTFYFGEDALSGAPGYSQTYLRRTVSTNDHIYFPATDTTATVQAVLSEHVIQLDSNPLGHAPSTTSPLTEWALVRTDLASFGNLAGGIKNPGFRVSYDGQIIISSQYTTFADAAPAETPLVPNRTELMRRGNQDVFQRGLTLADGWNLPGCISEDGIEPQSRYVGDVSFRGVAVGEPKPMGHRVLQESPCCAISWGDNLYGFVDRIKAEAMNEVRFYRQSFGPYNNAIRNLAIEGATIQPSPSSSLSELKILTRQHVYTRHGQPTSSTGNFATDGYRNCFVYPDWRLSQPYPSFAMMAVYTDALGGNPVRIEGPKPQLTTALASLSPANGLVGDFSIAANPSAPKVIWDGKRFVAAWVEGGYDAVSMLCIGVFPGDENSGLQTPELLDPKDVLTDMQAAQATAIDYRKVSDLSMTHYHLTVLDVAYSGNVYAVLWANGLDKGTVSNPGAALGVTLFDASGFGGGLDADLRPLVASAGLAPDGTSDGSDVFTSAGSGFSNDGVRAYDILIIRDGAGFGRYQITQVSDDQTLIVDRPIPTGANQHFTVHRRLMPTAGRTYVLGVTAGYDEGAAGGPRGAYVDPHIIWDGKQFVAVWRGMQWDNNPSSSSQDVLSLQKQFIPEGGLGQAPAIIKMAPPGQMMVSTTDITSNQPTQGIGYVEKSATAAWVRLSGAQINNLPGYTPQPAIHIGDTLIISSIYKFTYPGPNVSIEHAWDGWYRITEYDPATGSVKLGHVLFGNTSTIDEGMIVVYGAILSTGVGDQSQSYSDTNPLTPPTLNLPELPDGFGPNAGLLNEGEWATAGVTPTTPYRVFGLVYNEKRDEYVVLYDRLGKTILTGFKRGSSAPRVEVVVSAISSRTAKIAWNGQSFLVVYADDTNGTKWALYSQDFGLESSGLLCSIPGAASPPTDLIGTNPSQMPGPVCYGGFSAGSLMFPRPRNAHIEWNPRLNRWIVSLSMLWYSNETDPGFSHTSALPSKFPSAGLGGTVDTVTGQVLHFTAGAAGKILQYAQRGCKLLFVSGHNLAVYTILDSSDAARTITVDTVPTGVSGITPFDPTTASIIYVLPREDVWCFTLGYDTPAVQFLDADGSSLENVAISGSPIDIEERYNNMARPILQSGGSPVGAYFATAYDAATASFAIMRVSQYNSRLLAPKMELPQLTNVRSRTKIHYGHRRG